MRGWSSTIARRLGRLRGLRTRAERLLAVRIFLVAAVVPALIRLRLSTVESLLEPRLRPSGPPPDAVQRLETCVDLVLRAAYPVVRRGCLTRGLTLYYVLRRAGVDVRLCFGIGQVEGRFEAHCWLVRDDVPFLERRDPRPLFTEMYRIPGAPAHARAVGGA